MNVVIGPLHPPISTYKPTPIKYAKRDAQSNELQYKATKSYSVRVKKKKEVGTSLPRRSFTNVAT